MENSLTPRKIVLRETYYLQIFIEDDQGQGKPGLIIPYYIYQSKGGYLREQGHMIEDLNAPGVYVQSYLFDRLGQFRIIYRPPRPYKDMIEIVEVIDGAIRVKASHKHYHRHYINGKVPKIPRK